MKRIKIYRSPEQFKDTPHLPEDTFRAEIFDAEREIQLLKQEFSNPIISVFDLEENNFKIFGIKP